MLGFNYPGDPWYADAYNLMASKGYPPAQAPNPGGNHGPHFPFFGHPDKNTTLPPPGTIPAPTTDAGASQTTTAANPTNPPPAGPPAPPKKTGFWHGFLGL